MKVHPTLRLFRDSGWIGRKHGFHPCNETELGRLLYPDRPNCRDTAEYYANAAIENSGKRFCTISNVELPMASGKARLTQT